MDELIAKLRHVPLFAELQEPELERIAALVRREQHPAGHKIFSEGEDGQALYVIESGRVRISKNVPGIGEEALAVLEPGAVFGEMALLDDAPRSADATVQDSCGLLVLDRPQFESLLFVDKELAYHVLTAVVQTLAARLRETNEKIAAFFAMNKFG